MDCPRYDFHIHTKHLGCANETMEVPAILAECQRLGVTDLAITDHLNSLDKLEKHLLIKSDLQAVSTTLNVYFGVELNFCACDGEFAFSSEVKEQYGFQFAIGGIHTSYLKEYDLQKLVEIQHRHHIKTCMDPLVDVLVHPYWFSRKPFESAGWPWFDSMKVVPKSFARELGQVARETGTAVEINGGANLRNPGHGEKYAREYIDYLSVVAEQGCQFAFGSDAHDIGRLAETEVAREAAQTLQLSPDRIWHPAGEPFCRKD